MTSKLLRTMEANEEIPALVETERRLEEIALGEADTVAGRDGRTILLGRTQEQLRHSEAGRQSAILNALPAHIALLDTKGIIISVNEAWRRFVEANVIHAPGHAVGLNYVEVCERAQGEHSSEAHQVAAGIRAVLGGAEKRFSIEYPCHSPGEQRWFQLTVTPLADDRPIGVVVMHLNTTERKRAEAVLKESEERFSSAFEDAPIGVALVSPEGRWLKANRALCELLGYSEAELLTRTILDLTHPEDSELSLENVRRAIAGEHRSFQIEKRYIHRRGHVISALLSISLVRDGEGQPRYFVSQIQDVTERKRAEEALRASEAEFRTLAEAMPQIVWIARAVAGNIYFNQQWMDYTGLSLKESLGDGWNETFHPDDRERAQQSWQHARATMGTYSIEARLRRADGVYRWWLIRGVPMPEAIGKSSKWVGTCTDIDELKQAQERMGQQAALLDTAQDAILVKDLEDRIIYWNKGAERIYGWTAEEALGRTSTDLFGQDQSAVDGAQAALLATGEWKGETVNQTKEGHPITADVRWTLVRDERGQAKSILAINSDITEKKKLEAQFLRVQRMESIGTLASGIAHDLNNVLAPIMMAVEMLKDMVENQEGRSLLVTLESCTHRGAHLIKQVLSFARGVEGRRVPVNVFHILRDIENIVRDTFPKNISFEIDRPREVGTVLGDPTQLHQVFMNLCVNARDAMPLGGRLRVTLKNVAVDEIYAGMNPDSEVGSHVMIKVEDTGSGIPPSIKDKIFEPFFTTKEIGKGTGLGLSTTLAIVKSHGGFINLYSEAGKGAQFKVYLPTTAGPAASEDSQAHRTRLPFGAGELVLVVDDEEPIRTVTKKTLERCNYRVLLAANGAEAVAAYAKHSSEIALVLTDMAMPIMDGPATIVALRALNPDVSIIGCSGHASNDGIAKAMGAGVQHFISKPYTAETLLKILHQALQGEGKPPTVG